MANRVGIIRDLTKVSQWHHIPGPNNPADTLSRERVLEELDKKLWFEGSTFLRDYKSSWTLSELPIELDDDPEVRKVEHICQGLATDTTHTHPIQMLCHHNSSWYRLKRGLAWIMKTIQKLSGQDTNRTLSAEDIREAAPNDTAYKRWSCHSGFKLLCKLCRTSPPPAMGARFTVFGACRPCGPAGWLALLLTKAGDVETNPGPTTLNKKVWICDICHKQIHVRKQISHKVQQD